MTFPEGIINLHKPTGITSAKALYRVRAITRQRKSGHAGTLDPGASGVLLLCLGRATKLVERIMDMPKVYRATARLDVTSNSFDADAELESVRVTEIPSRKIVSEALGGFEGDIEQVPPLVSAVKVGGRPAYKLARQGRAVELEPRRVRIYWLTLTAYDWPELSFEVCCGRGTYIRAVIRDLGERLEVGGCLTSLVRTRVGPFELGDAWTFDSLERASVGEYVVPFDAAVGMLSGGSLEIPQRPAS